MLNNVVHIYILSNNYVVCIIYMFGLLVGGDLALPSGLRVGSWPPWWVGFRAVRAAIIRQRAAFTSTRRMCVRHIPRACSRVCTNVRRYRTNRSPLGLEKHSGTISPHAVNNFHNPHGYPLTASRVLKHVDPFHLEMAFPSTHVVRSHHY